MDPNKLAGGWAAGVVEPPKEKAGGFWSAVVPADEDEFPNEKDGAVDELRPEDPAFCCPVSGCCKIDRSLAIFTNTYFAFRRRMWVYSPCLESC